MNVNKEIVIQHSKPILFVYNYMLYAFVVGLILFYIYINEYGGKMPATGTLWVFVKDTWNYILGFAGAPILIKAATKYLEIKKQKKIAEELTRTQKRRIGDGKRRI